MKTTTERFVSKYKRNEETGCLEWTRATNQRGYGCLKIDNKTVAAHRLSFELFNGPIPDGYYVCHSCDNPKCVNPEHLFIGTHQDNVDDKVRKNRQAKQKGESNGRSKLSHAEVEIVYGLLQKNKTVGIKQFLARWFGVSRETIRNIGNGRCWSHLNPINQSLTV